MCAWHGPQRLDLRLGLRQGLVQGRTAAERRRPGAGADPHPVLRHPIQIDQILGDQRGDALGQEVVEQLDVMGAEIGERVIIGGDVPGDPLKRRVLPAEFVEPPRAADPFDGGVEPQSHEDLGVDGRAARSAFDRFDPVVQRGEVESFDVIPNDPRGVILGDQGIQGSGTKDDLLTIGRSHPRPSRRRGVGLGRRG